MDSRAIVFLTLFLIAGVTCGCGKTKNRQAREHLLISDAVDQAVGSIRFESMAGRKVFLDTQYIKNVKGQGFVNADYIVSSIRQQMVAADCRLVDSRDDAEIVAEARIGALGTNGDEIVYGIPATNVLSHAAAMLPAAPSLPTTPEISLARKDAHSGAAKIAVFAYDRETRQPIWQSGIATSKSTAQDFWILGAGPFQRGTLHDKMSFPGGIMPNVGNDERLPQRSEIALDQEHVFDVNCPNEALDDDRKIRLATFEESASDESDAGGKKANEPPKELLPTDASPIAPVAQPVEQP
jgi:hypothetical protein